MPTMLSAAGLYVWEIEYEGGAIAHALGSSLSTLVNGSHAAVVRAVRGPAFDQNGPPLAFSHLTPPNGTTGVEPGVELTWEPSIGADHYEVHVDGVPPTRYKDVTVTRLVPTNLVANGAVNQWVVAAYNHAGETYAPAWSFTMAGEPAPPAAQPEPEPEPDAE